MNNIIIDLINFVEAKPQLNRADYGDPLDLQSISAFQTDSAKIKNQLKIAYKLICKLVLLDFDDKYLEILCHQYAKDNRLQYTPRGFKYIARQNYSLEYRQAAISLLEWIAKYYGGTK